MEQKNGNGTLERRKGKAEAEAEAEQRSFPQSLTLGSGWRAEGVVAEKEVITKQRQTEAVTEAEEGNNARFPSLLGP